MDTGYGIGLERKSQIIPILAAEARASWYNTDGGESWADLNTFSFELVGRLKFGLLCGGLGALPEASLESEIPENPRQSGWKNQTDQR